MMDAAKVPTREDRFAGYKKQALAAVEARARNMNAPGIALVRISPHDVLELLRVYDEAMDAAHAPPAETL